MAQRIFTIVGRGGTAVVTDSKLNANGACTYDTLVCEDTQIASLRLLNQKLAIVPRGVRFETPVTYLLPQTISFLAYEDTRAFWLENGYRKNDEKKEQISAEVLAEVSELHKQLGELGASVRLFGQKGLKSPVFNNYVKASWDLMNQIVERPKALDASQAF